MRIEVNGSPMFFDIEGSCLSLEGNQVSVKPTLLLIHGGPGSDHTLFREFFLQFSDVVQIVYLDLRGQGRSTRSSEQYWHLSQWASDINAFCEILNIVKPIILGHSFGGMVAMRVAIEYPELPRSIILAHTIGRFNLETMLSRFEKLGGESAMLAAKSFWAKPSLESLQTFKERASPVYNRHWPLNILDVSARVKNSPDVSLYFWSDEGVRFDVLAELKQVRCDCLVFGGDADPFSGVEDMQLIVQALPEGRVESKLFHDCGHFFWWDAEEASAALIMDFCLRNNLDSLEHRVRIE